MIHRTAIFLLTIISATSSSMERQEKGYDDFLRHLATTNNTNCLKAVLNPNINGTDRYKNPLLILAVKNNCIANVRFLLKNPDILVNKQEQENKNTPLHWAVLNVQKGHYGIVDLLLLDPRTDTYIKNKWNCYANKYFGTTIEDNDRKQIYFFLSMIDSTIKHEIEKNSITSESNEVVRKQAIQTVYQRIDAVCEKQKNTVDCDLPITELPKFVTEQFMKEKFESHVSLVTCQAIKRKGFEKRKNLLKRTSEKEFSKFSDQGKMVLDQPDVSLYNNFLFSAILTDGSDSLVKIFNPNPNWVDKYGNTLLMLSTQYNCIDNVLFLLGLENILVNEQNSVKNTALHVAVSERCFALIKIFLMDPRFHVLIKNSSGLMAHELFSDSFAYTQAVAELRKFFNVRCKIDTIVEKELFEFIVAREIDEKDFNKKVKFVKSQIQQKYSEQPQSHELSFLFSSEFIRKIFRVRFEEQINLVVADLPYWVEQPK